MRLQRVLIAVSFVLVTSLWDGSHVQAQSGAGGATAAGSAEEPDAKKRASAHFRRGVELFQEGAYRAALVEFEKAYEVAPDYRLLYNIGQTKLQIQDYLGATQSYERYLTEGGGDVSSARREDVEKQLEALRERVGRLAITANRDDVELFVDDLKVGVTPMPGTVSVNVGRHRIYGQSADGASATRVLDVAGGELVEVKLELVAPKVATVVQIQGGDGKPLPTLKKVAIAAWVGAGVFGATALFTGLGAQSDQSSLDKELDKAPADTTKIGDLRDSADTKALFTDLLGGVAIAAAAAGVVCWVLAPKDDADETSKEGDASEASVELGFGPTSLFARGHF